MYYILSLTNATASCVKTHMLVILNVFVFNIITRQVRVFFEHRGNIYFIIIIFSGLEESRRYNLFIHFLSIITH